MEVKTETALKSTPGPWHWNEGGRLYKSNPESFSSDNILVVHDPVWRPSPADARLIAAAPELYAACVALQMEAAARGCGLRIADEAIAKARGE